VVLQGLRTSNHPHHKPTRSETRTDRQFLNFECLRCSNGEQVEVHPLPKELFTTAAPDLQPLRPGEWTIIIAHEPPECGEHPSEEMLRYAFLTASDPAAPSESDTTITSSPATEYEDITAPGGRHGVVIADMKVFLERVMNNDPLAQEALLNFWNEATRGLADRFGVCGKVEMVSVLEAMDFLFFRQSYR
jgi:hypothetical protein